ncbi:unnamed protein product [Brassica napus]|uniref:(rape) hypothetical protein n=1 Tax=Brassica napus TaxID=3708 RepID=A0A816K353_BRANA|nr:unnamed protein product [Brassica napus]
MAQKAVESYKKMAAELEQTKARMVWLEGLVTKLHANPEDLENNETLLKDYEEVFSLRFEVERLRAALEASEQKRPRGERRGFFSVKDTS